MKKVSHFCLSQKNIENQISHLGGAFEHNFGLGVGKLNKPIFKNSSSQELLGGGGGEMLKHPINIYTLLKQNMEYEFFERENGITSLTLCTNR